MQPMATVFYTPNFYKGMMGNYRSFVWTEHLGPDQICQLRDQVESEVREKLGIPFSTTGIGQLPGHMLKTESSAIGGSN